MRPSLSFSSLSAIDAPTLAIGIFEGEPVPNDLPSGDLIAALIASEDFLGGVGETLSLFGHRPNDGVLLIFGLGKLAAFGPSQAHSAGVAVSKKIAGKPRRSVAVSLPSASDDITSSLVSGLIVGTHGPGIRKKETSRHPFENLALIASPARESQKSALTAAIDEGRILGEAVNLARELVNTPPAEKTPAVFADRAAAIAREHGLTCEVWDLKRITDERFGGLPAVSRGSDHEPRFVRLGYRNGGSQAPIALVGKGVTFDSGGLSLKPSASMEDMKCDMAGAAAVLSALQACAQLKLAVNVDGYLPITENMTGGSAMKLGDVLTMRNGVTVEVLNTDAEGRLILADALSLAEESHPRMIVDLATLTGACLVALGSKIAGLFANDDNAAAFVIDASLAAGERVWRMPLDDDFGELIKSKVAEIKNVGGKWGGAISASKFLQKFVGDTPWVHLDIAGPAWADDESPTRDCGGTGAFTRTLVSLLKALSVK